jgi:hypothetical protein
MEEASVAVVAPPQLSHAGADAAEWTQRALGGGAVSAVLDAASFVSPLPDSV